MSTVCANGLCAVLSLECTYSRDKRGDANYKYSEVPASGTLQKGFLIAELLREVP